MLTQAVAKYKQDGWAAVACHTGLGVNARQCKNHWYRYLEPKQQGLRDKDDWTQAEVSI